MINPTLTVPVPTLRRFMVGCFVAAGLRESDAELVSNLMLEADLNGSDGHGVFRLPQYIDRIRTGGINRRPNIRVVRNAPAMALVDGDNGMGHLVVHHAANVAMDKAAEAGVAWVGIRGSNHAGAAGTYARLPLARDMIGIYIAVGNANHLPPWGGTEMLLSTNPIAIAIPGRDEPPIVLDMATTVAAYGKVKTKLQRGEPMPEGWMIDREGKPLTDPKRADEGFLLPIGGPKGSGLSLIFGLLAGTLNGAAFGKNVVDFNADPNSPTNTGQLVIAADIRAFGDVDLFRKAVDVVIRDIHASPTLPGIDRVRLPGERAHDVRQQRLEGGIPLHPALLGKLDQIAIELGLATIAKSG